MANQAVQLFGSHGGRDVEIGVRKQTCKRVSLMPGATGGNKLEAQSHLKKNGIVVGTIMGSIHPPAGDSHREIPGEGNVNVGAAKGGLECGNFAHVFDVEAVTEEEFLEFRATGIFVRSIKSTVGVGIDCQDESRGVVLGVLEEFHKPGGSTCRRMSR